jgi:SAM-dependent methyltransferase
MSSFDPESYWEQRLRERYDLEGVGWIGLGGALNDWMYRVRRRVFLQRLAPLLPDPSRARVLDVGSGTGFYVERWHELGAGRVAGSDITETAVAQLRQRFPRDRFERFDVGGESSPFSPGEFDAISAFDVLFHIVDDTRFTRAIGNLFSLTAPGGHLVFSDNFVHGAALRGEHQASRPLAEIEQAVREAGFEITSRRPMFVLLNTPVDSDSRVLHAWWTLLTKAASRADAFGQVLGAAAYPAELALVSRLREGPSTELMVCWRPAQIR